MSAALDREQEVQQLRAQLAEALTRAERAEHLLLEDAGWPWVSPEEEGDPLDPLAAQAPFPWMGGKRRVAPVIWQHLGVGSDAAPHYVEPFAGSLATLLARPDHAPHLLETVNDLDELLVNAWRAITSKPHETAQWADYPVSELDLHQRHHWLVGQRARIVEGLVSSPTWCDPQAAGWWIWGLSQWIGGGWCRVREKRRPHLSNGGAGVHRLVRGEKSGHGKPFGDSAGRGVQRTRLAPTSDLRQPRPLVSLQPSGVGVHRSGVEYLDHNPSTGVYRWMACLAARLRRVRICCGDWKRVLTPAVLWGDLASHGRPAAVLLDPPYSTDLRDREIYAKDSEGVAREVHAWCREHGDHPRLRVVLCGYEGEHNDLEALGWRKHAWCAHGGLGNNKRSGNPNRALERLWISPHCLWPEQVEPAAQLALFGGAP